MSKKKVLFAVASAGGHLIQLSRLLPAFSDYEVVIISTVDLSDKIQFKEFKSIIVTDSNFDQKVKLLVTAIQIFWYVISKRPSIIVTTGAAPGLFAIIFGKLILARSIWIDSIANAEELSFAGSIAKKLTANCYSQWQEVAKKNKIKFLGAVI
ncbi:MAG: UDP-N-acetylglucosamine:LPS N-acetylglucosamine transferase [Psychroserpens sp.]|jgi:UDP-N-acetylglucosamine:LPS N-acetylglucosamine transferase